MARNTLTSIKSLREVLEQYKYLTFDQEGSCDTLNFGKPLCNVYYLSSKLQEKLSNELGSHFYGPAFLYTFDSISQAREFLRVNLIKLDNITDDECNPERLQTMIWAIATTDTLLQYDSQILAKVKEYKGPGNILSWRALNNYTKDIRLVLSNLLK